jgi:hypothetical protein
MTIKYTRWKIKFYPNDHKIYQMDKYIPTFPMPLPSKKYPNMDFWYENIPSGNPAIISEASYIL